MNGCLGVPESGGDADPGVDAASRAIREVSFAAVGAGHEIDNRETQAGSAATAGLIGTAEAVERPWHELVGHTDALVGHVQLYAAVLAHSREGDRAGAMDERVLDEVVQRLLEARLVAVHDGPARVGDSKWASGSTGERVEPESDAFEQRVRVDGFSPQRQKALVVAGDEQQILGEPSQAVRFLRRRAQGVFEFQLRARPTKGELELRLEQRERRAQFVARIVDEAALVLDCGLEAREHFIQRFR